MCCTDTEQAAVSLSIVAFGRWSISGAMNPEEQTVTWLISLGVLCSPKKNIADPEEFLKTSLKDGVVLCKLAERLVPGFTPKVTYRDDWPNTNRSVRVCLRKGGVRNNWQSIRTSLRTEAGLPLLYTRVQTWSLSGRCMGAAGLFKLQWCRVRYIWDFIV